MSTFLIKDFVPCLSLVRGSSHYSFFFFFFFFPEWNRGKGYKGMTIIELNTNENYKLKNPSIMPRKI
jgi:hypothetical protein